ncbi:MAG: peptidoglycan DD-metalloendopeptidase family protein [Clostridia bacterium]|nr:peptidoglycan DD-metalloendopeptidase family protein [Clostridia bacterium]
MVCAILVAVAFIISVVGPALAATQQQIDNAKDKTEQAKKDSEDAEKRRQEALAQYHSIDKQINDTELEISVLETQIEQTKEDIALKEKELKQAENDYEEYEELFLKRARIMYESSEIKYLEILFGANDFSDFLTKLEMISQLMKYDRDILTQLDATKKKIESTKAEFEDILARQEENAKVLADRKLSLDKILESKSNLLAAAEKDAEKYKAIYEAAEAAEEALIKNNSEALSYNSNPVNYSGGAFAWPVPGVNRITSKYGYRIHPVYKTKKFHSGIDIGAGYGVNIVASADGVVTLATTNGGYGKCIIINHGSGITTLYGHCSSLLVSKGDKVTKGQVIAKIGSTGVSTGPHLHFEVRVNGSTRDPLSYVTG